MGDCHARRLRSVYEAQWLCAEKDLLCVPRYVLAAARRSDTAASSAAVIFFT